jgi:hypothetical protein
MFPSVSDSAASLVSIGSFPRVTQPPCTHAAATAVRACGGLSQCKLAHSLHTPPNGLGCSQACEHSGWFLVFCFAPVPQFSPHTTASKRSQPPSFEACGGFEPLHAGPQLAHSSQRPLRSRLRMHRLAGGLLSVFVQVALLFCEKPVAMHAAPTAKACGGLSQCTPLAPVLRWAPAACILLPTACGDGECTLAGFLSSSPSLFFCGHLVFLPTAPVSHTYTRDHAYAWAHTHCATCRASRHRVPVTPGPQRRPHPPLCRQGQTPKCAPAG